MNRVTPYVSSPAIVAYTGPIPATAALAAPVSKPAVVPRGERRISSTTLIGRACSKSGAGERASEIGTTAREINTEETMKGTNPLRSPMLKSS